MLRICVVADSFVDGKRFIEWKFETKIVKVNAMKSVWTLAGGDEVHLAHNEASKDTYLSMEYDAFLVTPRYETLLDIIKSRCVRKSS
jgi:hypothetical protein